MNEPPVHILYATHDGHAEKIAYRLAGEGKYEGRAFFLHNLGKENPDPFYWPENALIVLVAPIRYGFHLPEAERFLRKNAAFIDENRLVMVSVNLTARKPQKNTPRTNPYFRKWVKKHALRPALGAVFGGKLDYPRYPLWEKWAIRLIMAITGGPTDFQSVVDYTNWEQVEALARHLIKMKPAEKRKAA